MSWRRGQSRKLPKSYRELTSSLGSAAMVIPLNKSMALISLPQAVDTRQEFEDGGGWRG